MSQTEWTLYLQQGTVFDAGISVRFQLYPLLTVTFITHKSDRNRLKRIEGQTPGGRVEILWSHA